MPVNPTNVSVVSGSVHTRAAVGVPVISREVVPYVPEPKRNKLRSGFAVLPASTPVCARRDVLMLTPARLFRDADAPAPPPVPHGAPASIVFPVASNFTQSFVVVSPDDS